jgi:hypothetical protein
MEKNIWNKQTGEERVNAEKRVTDNENNQLSVEYYQLEDNYLNFLQILIENLDKKQSLKGMKNTNYNPF